jgi:ketosteroid isomerase-like protein
MANTFESNTQSRSPLADEAAISKLAARFADAVNRRDQKEFRALWTPQGVWEIKPPLTMQVQGVDGIVAAFIQLLDGWEFFVQMVHSGTIEIEGDRATARWCMNEIGRSTTGKGFHNFGLYADELVRQDDRWLFARRTYHYAYIEEPTLPGNAFSLADIADPGAK